jgi:hypothetical protein
MLKKAFVLANDERLPSEMQDLNILSLGNGVAVFEMLIIQNHHIITELWTSAFQSLFDFK